MTALSATQADAGRPSFRLGLPAQAIHAGQRYAVYTLEIPHEASPEAEAHIAALAQEANPLALQWLLAQGLYRRVTLAGVSLANPPARPLGDLLVDLFDGRIYRLRHARAFDTGLVVEPSTLNPQRH